MFDQDGALAKITEGLDELLGADLGDLDADSAAKLIVELERQGRRVDAARVEMVDAIDRSGAYRADGHFSAKVMVRHHAVLSGPEAWIRATSSKMLRDLPALRAAHARGSVGTDQIRRLARVWANPRVGHHLRVCEAVFLDAAQTMEFPDFDRLCRDWEQAVDSDGADQRRDRRWVNRQIAVVQDHNGLWDLRGRLGSLDGAQFDEILARVVDAERLADIDEAKAEHGDEWRAWLPRTEPQLRHDAFMALIRRVAATAPGTTPAATVTNLVIDDDTYTRHLARLFGADTEPIDPLGALDPDRHSRTADGVWVDPADMVARSLIDHIRRVVVNSAGTIIDLGRKQRLFTGSARDAAMLQAIACYWKGCWTPASTCQIDHLDGWAGGGRTDPGNGAPGCGHHNRIKERGFHAWRDASGEWRITRPDGSPVPDHTAHWNHPDPSADDLGRAA